MADSSAEADWVKRVLGVDVAGVGGRLAWEAAFAGIETRLNASLKTAANADELRAVRDFALGRAESGDYGAAMTSLERLRMLLDAATPTQTATQDLVTKRIFLLERWSAIPAEIDVPIQGLQSKIAETLPHENAGAFCAGLSRWFTAKIDEFRSEFETAIDTSINGGDASYAAVSAASAAFRTRLAQDEVLALMREEAFFDGDLVENAFSGAMDEIETALAA